MRYPPFLTQRERDLLEILEQNPDGTRFKDLTKQMKIALSTVNSIVFRIRRKYTEHGMISPVGTQRLATGSIYYLLDQQMTYRAELYDRVEALHEVVESQEPKEGDVLDLGSFQIPIGVLWAADWHLGHKRAHYRAIRQIADVIAEIPNLYLIGAGDLLDNSTNWKAPQDAHDFLELPGQQDLLRAVFDRCRSKILGLWEGNHEARSYLTDHHKITKAFAFEYRAGYGDYGLPAKIEVLGQTSGIYVRHKAKGGSQYNPLHPCIRCCLFENAARTRDADIIVTAHTHKPGCGSWNVGGRWRTMIATGTNVLGDDFGERVGFSTAPDRPFITILTRGRPFTIQGLDNARQILAALEAMH